MTTPDRGLTGLATENPNDPPVGPGRRRRRSQAEIIDRILTAAHQQFNEFGYQATTTKEIAKQADVSETLLYRHFKSKAGLFDRVIFDPFDILAQQLLRQRDESDNWDLNPDRGRALLDQMMGFLDHNRKLLCDLAVKGLAETADEGADHRLEGMRRHYRAASAQVRAFHEAVGRPCPFDPDIAVRLALGMLLASSLFSEWLFPDGVPDRNVLAENIRLMMVRALAAPGADQR